MASPADRQVEAREDVERLARELYHAFKAARPFGHSGMPVWEDLEDAFQVYYRAVVTDILHRDVIRVGHRPNRERPMTDQMRFEEQISHERREALDELRP
jgi:hypothetical protein